MCGIRCVETIALSRCNAVATPAGIALIADSEKHTLNINMHLSLSVGIEVRPEWFRLKVILNSNGTHLFYDQSKEQSKFNSSKLKLNLLFLPIGNKRDKHALKHNFHHF